MARKNSTIIFMLLIFFFLPVRFLSAQDTLFAPDFKLEDLHQDTVSLSSFKGKQPVILFFWTTWCPFCRKELNILNSRYQELISDGWEILAINIGEPARKVSKFTEDYALAFKVLLDADFAVSYAYDILGVPTYVLADKKGRIIYRKNYFPEQYNLLLSGD